MKILQITFALLLLAFIAGVVQVYQFDHELDKCQKYIASYDYFGYECSDRTYYIQH
jgi:hypothetical protein